MNSDSECEYDSSSKKRPYKKGKSQNRGRRCGSPWYHLIGRLEKRFDAKECIVDYKAGDFKCNKRRIKRGGRC